VVRLGYNVKPVGEGWRRVSLCQTAGQFRHQPGGPAGRDFLLKFLKVNSFVAENLPCVLKSLLPFGATFQQPRHHGTCLRDNLD